MSEITELALSLTADDERNIFGEGDSYIRKIENSLKVEIIDRNGQLHIIGQKDDAARASQIIRELVQLSRRGTAIEEQSVEYAISLKKEPEMEPEAVKSDNVLADIDRDIICHTISGKPIRPKTLGQKRYIDAIRNKMIVFGIGPAGTGKTYLAMAMAITAFQRDEVSRIILTRPAIEAGEKLGFLPGDLQSKVDPYLRPLYDALYQIMGAENFLKNMEKGLIEVAPLAYMRGRTLDNAFIILDEAQNTTPQQMKMFLTRIGFGSRAIITGDATQKDLAPDVKSGLDVAATVLKNIDDIAFCNLTSADVVRHPLVQKIVKAYEDYEKKAANSKTIKNVRRLERSRNNGRREQRE
jgi:phosphate starvation-inducible PhoH-like protein